MIWGWTIFAIIVTFMLALDLGVFKKESHTIKPKEAFKWSAIWVAISITFCAGVYVWMGKDKAVEFVTSYLIEKSLSLDNIFIFLLIFKYFKIEGRYQHKILYWGVLGALILRGIMIALGLTLLKHFEWIIYVFGLILIYSAIRMLIVDSFSAQISQSPVLLWLETNLPFTKNHKGSQFWVKIKGRYLATPLFLVLLSIEFSDLIFAIDSIPAVLAITYDPFIIYTSNIFAILGLRAMYFLLADIVPRFKYLHEGLAAILIFVGLKMLISDYYKISAVYSLLIIILILTISIIFSIFKEKKVV